MAYQRLLIFCEGPDDERFFNAVIKPHLSDVYNRIRTVPYAEKEAETISRYIHNAQQTGIDLLFTCDRDDELCITACLESIRTTFGEHLSPDSIYYGVNRHFVGCRRDLTDPFERIGEIPEHVALSVSEEPLRRIATSSKRSFAWQSEIALLKMTCRSSDFEIALVPRE